MQPLLTKLVSRFPELTYRAGEQFYWSPQSSDCSRGEIIYNQAAKGKKAEWALLHETGHALLRHSQYQADFELLQLEVAAWQQARLLASELNIQIDEDHIQNCLDTYRDWLYQRSICPKCHAKCLQQSDFVHYRCFNCHTTWKVSSNRFARAYRRTKASTPPELNQLAEHR